MLLSHAIALAEARTYLAALANQAEDLETSVAYEQVLLHLDAIHRIDVPRIEASGLVDDLTTLHTVAESAISELADHSVIDALQVELLLAMLSDVRDLRGA